MSPNKRSRRQASVEYPRHRPANTNNQNSHRTRRPTQSQPLVSDYESDVQFGSLSDQPPPAQASVPARTVDELNLTVLQRYNPSIVSILSIAPYAVIYAFSPTTQPEWIKTGVEGSLFICQLLPGPLGEDRFAAIVLNRRGLENFEAELREDETGGVELTDEYIIVTSMVNSKPTASGIWVFSEGPGSSTAMTKTLVGQFIKDRAVQAGLSQKAAEEASRLQNRSTHTMPHAYHSLSAPMDRQISLQEMLGQQRKDDDEWSVKVHSPDGGQMPSPPLDSAKQLPPTLQTGFEPRQAPGPPLDHLQGLLMNAALRR